MPPKQEGYKDGMWPFNSKPGCDVSDVFQRPFALKLHLA